MNRLMSLVIVSYLLLVMAPLYSVNNDYPPVADNYGSFSTDTTYSFDKALRFEISDVESMIKIIIYRNDDNTEMFCFKPVRKWDFWGCCWENENYNLWIQSGDVGVLCYEYNGVDWKLKPNAKKPSYIVTKYEIESN